MSQTRFDAKWIEFLSAFELQDPEARQLLEKLQCSNEASSEQTLRLLQAKAFMELELDRNPRAAAQRLELARGLLSHVSDPIARTSFLNLTSSIMVYLAAYDRALECASEQIDAARSAGLDFAADHALTARAGALIGLRKIAAAHRTLQELEGRSDSASPFVVGQIHLKRSRLKAAVGDVHPVQQAFYARR